MSVLQWEVFFFTGISCIDHVVMWTVGNEVCVALNVCAAPSIFAWWGFHV